MNTKERRSTTKLQRLINNAMGVGSKINRLPNSLWGRWTRRKVWNRRDATQENQNGKEAVKCHTE